QGIAAGGWYNNLGYIYASKYEGDGRVLFDPSYSQSSPLVADRYSNPVFLSTDGGGECRSSYMFNPRVVNALTGDNHRSFPKASSPVTGLKTFIMDYCEGGGGPNLF